MQALKQYRKSIFFWHILILKKCLPVICIEKSVVVNQSTMKIIPILGSQ